MMRRACVRLALTCAMSCTLPLVLFVSSAQAVQVQDDRGALADFASPPQRIVSLLPSLTETVCALGFCHRLVGVDRYSNHPAQVRRLPPLGGGIDPNIEAIVSLRPDVVLMAGSGRGIQRLESLGLKVLALEPKDIADMRRVMDLLARMLGSGDAARIWQAIDADIGAAAQSLAPQARRARVYFEASRGPYAAGPRSFIGEMLQRLGVGNIIPAELGPFPLISPEFVVRADPEVLMLTELAAQELQQRPGWSGMRAMRMRRVCIFTPEQGDVLVRPRPAHGRGRLADGAMHRGQGRAMRRLHGDLAAPRRLALAMLLLGVAVLLLGLSVGSTGWHGVWAARLDPVAWQIVWDIRLPRSLGAWMAGALLGLAGALAQGLFRNPLADPYLLGSASGASLGVALALALFAAAPAAALFSTKLLVQLGLTGAAFLGAMLGVLLTLALARGVQHTLRLLLAGVVVGVVLGAARDLITIASPEVLQAMQAFMFGSTAFVGWDALWLMGGLWLLGCHETDVRLPNTPARRFDHWRGRGRLTRGDRGLGRGREGRDGL